MNFDALAAGAVKADNVVAFGVNAQLDKVQIGFSSPFNECSECRGQLTWEKRKTCTLMGHAQSKQEKAHIVGLTNTKFNKLLVLGKVI